MTREEELADIAKTRRGAILAVQLSTRATRKVVLCVIRGTSLSLQKQSRPVRSKIDTSREKIASRIADRKIDLSIAWGS